jgi:hypothetical protein
MTRRVKIILLTPIGLAIAIGASLATLGAIARARGVARGPIPTASLIEPLARDADYADSYSAVVSAALFPDTRTLDRFAFQRSALAGRTADEIMYTGGSSGLVYHISYLRRPDGGETRLFVSTTVHYRNWRGRLYFALVRPGHRQLTPFMVSVMIRQALGASPGP